MIWKKGARPTSAALGSSPLARLALRTLIADDTVLKTSTKPPYIDYHSIELD